MDQKMILKFIFLFLTFSIEKSVSFKNELDSSIPHDDKTKSLSIKCGLECIFKCLTRNDNGIDYKCLHVCLPNCPDASKDGQINEDLDLAQLTMVQLCSRPCNSDERQVTEVVCDFCKEVSSTFIETYGNFTIHYGCTFIDPCTGKKTESWIQKWCGFCTAIKDWIDPNQPIAVPNQIKELDPNFEKSTINKQKQPHWIEWNCQTLCQLDKDTSSRGLQLNCSDPDLTKQTKIADLDERLNEICGGMCPDDIDNDNEFCLRCKIFSPSEESVSQFCRKIEKPDWWCIQLKCAEWRPYTSYETEEEDTDSKARPSLIMSAGKNYSF